MVGNYINSIKPLQKTNPPRNENQNLFKSQSSPQASFTDILSNLKTNTNKPQNDINGTDLAYEELAHKFVNDFLAIMWNYAFATIEVDPLTGGGSGEEMFKSLKIHEQVNEAYATQKGGLYDNVYNSLKRKGQFNDSQQNKYKGVTSESG